MLQIFKSNQPFIALVIPLICAVLLLPILFMGHEEFYTQNLYNITWIKKSWILYLICLGAISASAMMVNRFLIKSNLYTVKNYIPAILYTVFTSTLILWTGFEWVIVANVFLVLSLMHFFAFFSEISVLNAFFRSGFWLGISVIFMPTFIFFLPAYFFILIQNRTFKIKEWLVLIIGVAFPFIYFLSASLFLDESLFTGFEINISISQYLNEIKAGDWPYITYNILAGLAVLIGLFYFFRSYRKNVKKTLIARNSFLYIIISCIPILGIYLINDSCNGMLGIALPMSCLISFSFFDEDNGAVPSLWFNILVLGILTTSIVYNYF